MAKFEIHTRNDAFMLTPAEDGLHNVIIQIYALQFDTFQTSDSCKLNYEKKHQKAKHAQTKLQNARNAQAKLQNATCETTRAHHVLGNKNVAQARRAQSLFGFKGRRLQRH